MFLTKLSVLKTHNMDIQLGLFFKISEALSSFLKTQSPFQYNLEKGETICAT